jgi:asparagine synthase (glutamine-hydrolysing)
MMSILPQERAALEDDELLRSWSVLKGATNLERMAYVDQRTYLPDDILVKVDRATMSVGLEARVPLLDHEFVELAWHLPERFKIRDGVSKWLLRQLLYRYVPREIVDRPKAGFAVPLERWLRGPLREWLTSTLDPGVVRRVGLLDPAVVQRMLLEHSTGVRRWHAQLWCAAMLHAWIGEGTLASGRAAA